MDADTRPTLRFVVLVCVFIWGMGLAHAEAPRLMLATVWAEEDDPTGWWLSEKFDGVRGYWDGQEMLGRSGNRFALPESFRAELPPFPVDGELWAGRGQFAKTLSIVRDSNPGPGWSDIRYVIFDAPKHGGTFETRIEAVRQWLSDNPSSRVLMAEQTLCTGRKHLKRFLAEVESGGGEGVMLRAAGSAYQNGRSAGLRKHKSFDDTEATVVGYNPGNGKYAGMVGSLEMELTNGTRFALGSGLGDSEHRNPPPVGSTVTFKHYGWTRHGKPRFPVFWRIRVEP